MQIDPNTNLVAYAISIIVFLLGVLNTVGLVILNGLKKNDETLFNLSNSTAKKVRALEVEIPHLKEDVKEVKENCIRRHP